VGSIKSKKLSWPAQAKKALGQNFLQNNGIAKALVGAAVIDPEDTVVEIGPGKGMITQFLLERVRKVIAVEKDEELFDFLKEKFSKEVAEKKIILVHGDILKFNPSRYAIVASDYKLIGAIPYNITGALFKYFLQKIKTPPKSIAFIIQREVAQRILTKKEKRSGSIRGKENLLSISIKAYGSPRYIKTVRRGSFWPIPKVDSAIFVIENISKDFFETISEKKFFALLRAGFAHKRKFLVRNIENVSGYDTKTAFSICKIPERARAEDLSLENWRCLAKNL